MFDTHRIARDFSDAASHYARHATMQYAAGERLVAMTAPHLKPDTLLLDAGSGSGAVSRLWPARTIGLDGAFGMCRETARHLPVVQAGAGQLPFASATFDAVASNMMLQWLPAPELFFAEARRVLRPGGMLAFTTFGEATLGELQQAFTRAGQSQRISDFTAADTLRAMLGSFDLLEDNQQIHKEYYRDVGELYAYLRAIGATNKRTDRPRGLLTPRILARVRDAYARDGEGIVASWEIITMVARKR